MIDRSFDVNMGAEIHHLRATVARLTRHAQDVEARLQEARRDHWEVVEENLRLRAEVERLTVIAQNSHPHVWHRVDGIPPVQARCYLCGLTKRWETDDAD